MGVLSQPRYPAIERQDLTQGQLGSFKFTPIDIQRENSILGETPMLWQAQAKLRQRLEQQPTLRGVAWNSKSRGSSPKRNAINSTDTWSPQPQSPLSNPDSSFFNKCFKPDLEDSRLRMGPAALRTAVNGNSPQHNSRYRHFATVSHSYIRSIRSLFNLSCVQNPPSYPSLPSSQKFRLTMNPAASSFDPTSSSSDSGHERNETMVFNASLCRALLAEQQAHQETQKDCEALKMELESLIAQHKSLLESHKMMEAIVTLNAEKSDHYEKQLQMLKVNYTTYNAYHKAATQEVPRTPKQTEAVRKSESDEALFVKQLSPESDHSKLFNLELLNHQTSTDPKLALQNRALRKHFSFDTVSFEATEDMKATTNEVIQSGELIHLAPGDDHTMPSSVTEHQDATPTKKSYQHQNGKLYTAENSMLQLPASFLAKYGAKKKVQTEANQNDVAIEAPQSVIATPVISGYTASPASGNASSLEKIAQDNSNPTVVNIVPFDLSIKWHVTKENPIYDEDEFSMWGVPRQTRGEIFYKHPVRYLEYGDNDKNIFRTVMIDSIPEEATYEDVVEQVCGGSLEKIELVRSVGVNARGKTARVVFNFELGASTTANYARDHGMVIKGQPVRVWQIITPTYPKNKELDRNVFDNCFTRILIINNASRDALDTIPQKLYQFQNSIVRYSKTFDRYPSVEFTSIATAVKAMYLLLTDPIFAGAEFDFDDDYCGEPYPFTY